MDPNPTLATPTPSKHRRISLAFLLLIPLILSPAFLSLRDAWFIASRRTPPRGLEVFAFGAAYSLVLLTFAYRRRKALKSALSGSLVFWSLLRGAAYGGLFGLLFFAPSMSVQAAEVAMRRKFWNLARLIDFGIDYVVGFGVFVLIFVIVGAAMGGVFGLFISRPYSRSPQNESLKAGDT